MLTVPLPALEVTNCDFKFEVWRRRRKRRCWPARYRYMTLTKPFPHEGE